MFSCEKFNVNEIIFVTKSYGNPAGSITDYPTAKMHHCQLLYKLSGKAHITFDGRTVTEKSDCVRFLPSSENFQKPPQYRALVEEYGESINIGFVTGSDVPGKITAKDFSQNFSLRPLFLKLSGLWYKKENGYYTKCMSVLYEIISVIADAENTYSCPSQYKKIKSAVDYIDENFTSRNIKIEYLSELCGISHTYLTRLFRKSVGMTPEKYIITKKLNYACDLIAENTRTLCEISELCGFSNLYYFSRVFKKHFGVCPSLYKP